MTPLARFVLSLVSSLALAGATAGPAHALGGLRGTVTSSDGVRLAGFQVEVYNAAGDLESSTCTGTTGVLGTSGLYNVPLDPGSYRVFFSGGARPGTCGTLSTFAPEYWQDVRTLAEATPVTIMDGATTDNISAVVDAGASLAGKVTVDGTGTAIGNATVNVRSRTKAIAQTLCTAADGAWKATRLPPGTFYVEVQHTSATCGDAGQFADEFYDGKDLAGATPIGLVAGQDRVGIDVALTPANRPLTVTFTGTGSGTVVSSPPGLNCSSTCTRPIENGTVVTLSAAPADGSTTFTGWGGACSGTGDCTFTMSTDRAVTAEFTKGPAGGGGGSQKLSVALAGTGSGTVTDDAQVIACPSTCSADLPTGAFVTLTAKPAAGSTFTGWSGPCTGTGVCRVEMRSAQTVTATFAGTPGAGGGDGGGTAGGGAGGGTAGTGAGAGTPGTGAGAGTTGGAAGTGAGTPGTGTTTKPSAPRCTLTVRSAKVVRGVLKATVRCDQAATVTLKGTATERARKGKGAKKRALKAVKAPVRAGAATTVSLRLPTAATRALKARRSLSLALTLTATNANGRASAKTSVRKLRR